MLCLKCKGQVMSIDVDERIADKYINANTAHFEFCERWSGMQITVQFTQKQDGEDKTYNVKLDEVTSTVSLPNEIVAGEVDISAFGVHPVTGVRITSVPVKKKVDKSGFIGDGDTPIPPTPDLYSQLLTRIDDEYNAWSDATVSVENIESDAEPGVDVGINSDGAKNIHLKLPRGESGVRMSREMPTDPNVLVWIDEGGEDDVHIPYESFGIPVLDMSGDITGMNKDNAVNLVAKFCDYTAVMALKGRTYYSDVGLTAVAGTATENYRAYWASDTARSFSIDGTTYYMSVTDCAPHFEIVDSVTCKWQGSSSLWYSKKNYTVKFSNAFLANEKWGAQTKYCLKANFVDASNIRNILGATIWGRLVKSRDNVDERLLALPNGGAIDGFPIWVTINGKSVGLYTMNIPKDGWMFGMAKRTGKDAIVSAENYRWDAEPIFDGDVEVEYADAPLATQVHFHNAWFAVYNTFNENDLPAFEEAFDVDSIIDYMIFSSLVCHHDGIVKNALYVTFDQKKWFMSAYDMDSIFGNQYDGQSYLHPFDSPTLGDIHTCRGGTHALFDIVKKFYKQRLQTRWETTSGWLFTNARMYEIAYNLAIKFPQVLVNEDYRLWPDRPGTLTNNVDQILTFFRLRLEWMKENGRIYDQIWPKA